MISLFLALFLAAPASAPVKPEADLQGDVRWGMSFKEVKALKGVDLYDGVLLRLGRIQGATTGSIFEFIDDKLATVYVTFETTNANFLIGHGEAVARMLGEKYPVDVAYQELWNNDLFRGEAQYLETALGSGHVEWFGRWANERTVLTLTLQRRADGVVRLTMLYMDRSRMDLIIQKNKADAQNDL